VSVLKSINADVVILQEALGNEVLNRDGVRRKFAELGYHYGAFAGGAGKFSNYGNVILSKYPFASNPVKRNFNYKGKEHARSFVKIELDLSKFKKANLVIYGSHFNKSHEQERWEEASEIIYLADKHDTKKNVLVAADFNETRKGKATQELEKNGFADCFVSTKLPEPAFTHWSGKTIDHIYLRNKDLKISGCYLWYSDASDHLPVIMDINLS